MNFLCHAIPYLDDPLVTIGTGLPDMLRVVNRRLRAREQHAQAVLDQFDAGGSEGGHSEGNDSVSSDSETDGFVPAGEDPQQQPSTQFGGDPDDAPIRRLAQGIIHHHQDDHWFHTTAAFAQTNLELAVSLRDRLPGDTGFRPMFVGHIIIEMLLDGFWVRDRPDLAERYYAAFDVVPAEQVQLAVSRIVGQDTSGLDAAIGRFTTVRFLYDYMDPDRLLMRLNQVMLRVGLPEMSQSVLPWLQEAGELVESRRAGFLTRPDGSSLFPPLPQD